MRKLPLIFSGLLFALPAAAEPANSKPEAGDAPAEKPAPSPDSEPRPAAPPPKAASPVTPSTPVKASEGATTTVSGPAVAVGDSSWKFEYHGYIRAPMRVGVGSRPAPKLPYPGAAAPYGSGHTLHDPVIPDDQYLSWQSTAHNKTDWAEMFFSIGNSWAKGTVSIQGYNFAQGSFSYPTTQLGISDGYVDLTPDLGYENFRLALRAGAFSNKYGSAGKYDAGEYDTYMFGRTHTAGEALHIDYDIDENNSLWFEHGIGAKKPDPSQYDNTRFTMLNHAHVGFSHTQAIQFSAHYLDSWTQEEERIADPGTAASNPNAIVKTNAATSVTNIPDGKMWVAGIDGRFDLGAYGYLYAAYSHIGLKDAITVSRAIEVIHASGGGEFGLGVVDNYLGPSCVGDATNLQASYYPTGRPHGYNGACSLGNGGVDTLLAQYEFDLTNFTQQSSGGQKFWGEGQDLVLKLYGMYNKVKSDFTDNDGIHKLKFGGDLAFAAVPWMTAAVRFDRLQPNSRVPEQSFAILSPRLVFKSKWVTREAITLQYSHYFYNQRTCAAGNPADGVLYEPGETKCVQPPSSPVPPDGFGSGYPSGANAAGGAQRGAPTTRPDENVFKIEATMWW